MAPSTESKKASAAPATNGDAKAAAKETSAKTETTQTPVAAEQQEEEEVEIVKLPGSHGKPDPEDNRAKMDAITKQIEKTQAEVNNVRSLLSGSGPSADTPEGKRRAELRAQLDTLRNKQAGSKGSRGKILDELKALQESVAKKQAELKAARAKASAGTSAGKGGSGGAISPEEIDAQIAQIEKRVESGSLKIVDERRALAEISQLRKLRKSAQAFDGQQKGIDEERKKIDALRAQLDDPESRELAKEYDRIRGELDTIQQAFEAQAGSRSKLLDQRTALSAKLDALYNAKRQRHAAFKAANDAYYDKAKEERAKREEKYRAERKAQEDAKKREHEKQLREDAALPAFANEIEDCDVLINYFSGNRDPSSSSTQASTSSSSSAASALGKKLELRSVEQEQSAPEGAKVARKKGEEDSNDFFFVAAAGKGGKKQGKHGKKGKKLDLSDDAEPTPAAATGSSGGSLNIPLGHLTALLQLSIPPPANTADVARVIDNLKLKRKYFESNQERQTQENIAKVEKLLSKSSLSNGNTNGEAEAAPAPAAAAEASA